MLQLLTILKKLDYFNTVFTMSIFSLSSNFDNLHCFIFTFTAFKFISVLSYLLLVPEIIILKNNEISFIILIRLYK